MACDLCHTKVERLTPLSDLAKTSHVRMVCDACESRINKRLNHLRSLAISRAWHRLKQEMDREATGDTKRRKTSFLRRLAYKLLRWTA